MLPDVPFRERSASEFFAAANSDHRRAARRPRSRVETEGMGGRPRRPPGNPSDSGGPQPSSYATAHGDRRGLRPQYVGLGGRTGRGVRGVGRHPSEHASRHGHPDHRDDHPRPQVGPDSQGTADAGRARGFVCAHRQQGRGPGPPRLVPQPDGRPEDPDAGRARTMGDRGANGHRRQTGRVVPARYRRVPALCRVPGQDGS